MPTTVDDFINRWNTFVENQHAAGNTRFTPITNDFSNAAGRPAHAFDVYKGVPTLIQPMKDYIAKAAKSSSGGTGTSTSAKGGTLIEAINNARLLALGTGGGGVDDLSSPTESPADIINRNRALAAIPDNTQVDPKVAAQLTQNQQTQEKANAAPKGGGWGLGDIVGKIANVTKEGYRIGDMIAGKAINQTAGRAGGFFLNPTYEANKAGTFWSSFVHPTEAWDALQSGWADVIPTWDPTIHTGSDINHEAGFLQPVKGAPWWQNAPTNVANYVVSTGTDIVGNPVSYATLGAGATPVAGLGAAEIATEEALAPGVLRAVGKATSPVNIDETFSGVKFGSPLGSNVAPTAAQKIAASASKTAKANATPLSNAVVGTGNSLLTHTDVKKVQQAYPETVSRAGGGLPFTHAQSTMERQGLAAQIGVAAYNKGAEAIAKYEQLIKNNPNTKVKPPPGWVEMEAARIEAQQKIAEGVKASLWGAGNVKTKLPPNFNIFVQEATEAAKRRVLHETQVATYNTALKHLEDVRHQGTVSIRTGLKPLASTGRKPHLIGGKTISGKIYEAGSRATEAVKNTKLGLPRSEARELAAEAAGEHTPWLYRTHENPLAAAIGLLSHHDNFPGKLGTFRQNIMSRTSALMHKEIEKIKEYSGDLSPNDHVRIRQAIAEHRVDSLPPRLQTAAERFKETWQDYYETEAALGLRDSLSTPYYEDYVPLLLRGGTGGEHGTRTLFLQGRKAAIRSGDPNEIAKYSWEEALKQGLRPSNDLAVVTGNRLGKTMSQIDQSGYTASIYGQYGAKGQWTDREAKEMGLKAVEKPQQRYIKAMAGPDEQIEWEKPGMRAFVPIEMYDSYKTIGDMLKVHNPYEISSIAKMYDTGLGFWKYGQTILNPAAQLKNLIGDVMAAWADGVSPRDFLKHKAKYEMIEGKRYPKPVVIKGKLNTASVPFDRIEKRFSDFSNMGLASADLLRSSGNMSTGKFSIGEALGKPMNLARSAKEMTLDWADRREKFARSAHFHTAFEQELKERIKQADRKGIKYNDAQQQRMIEDSFDAAQNRTNKWHVDYTNLTPAELKYARRTMSFYTFMRGIIPTMFQQSLFNPGRLWALESAKRNLPILWSGRNPSDPNNPTVPPYRLSNGGVQLNNAQEPLIFDNTMNPADTIRGIVSGDVGQNILGKLSPAWQIPISAMEKKNSIGQPVTNLGDAISGAFPGTGDNLIEKIRSRLPPTSLNPIDWANYFGGGLKTSGVNEQLSEAKNQGQSADIVVSQLNRKLQEKGYSVNKTSKKNEWTIHLVDPATGKSKKVIGKYYNGGVAMTAALALAGLNK